MTYGYYDQPDISAHNQQEIAALKARLAAAESRKQFEAANETYTRNKAREIIEEANIKLGLDGAHALTGSEAELDIQTFAGTPDDYVREARRIARLRRDKLNADAEKAKRAKAAEAESAKPITRETFDQTLHRYDSSLGPRPYMAKLKSDLAKAEERVRASEPEKLRKVGDL